MTWVRISTAFNASSHFAPSFSSLLFAVENFAFLNDKLAADLFLCLTIVPTSHYLFLGDDSCQSSVMHLIKVINMEAMSLIFFLLIKIIQP